MTSPTKPVYELFNQKRYLKHRQRLATIQSEKPAPQLNRDLQLMHRLKTQSISFHLLVQEEQIEQENERLLDRLLRISKREAQYGGQAATRMVRFDCPARKKKEEMIAIDNQKMAQRLLARQSELDGKVMRKSMEQYERLKRTIANNRKALSTSHHQLVPLPRKLSQNRMNPHSPEDR